MVATVGALLYLTPTFFITCLPGGAIFAGERIHLGLDLQGGSHLVLEVKVDKAIENNVERIKTDLTNLLRDRGISGVSVERVQGTQLQVKVPAASVERVRALLTSDFTNLSVVNTQTGGGTTDFFLSLSKEELRSLRDYSVDQSLETIRNRIDQFGVSEPIIHGRGSRIF
jgi:preprotein translocase subunit SecD